jgi:hypothetical protein
VRDAGIEPWSASGAAERQDWVADLADAGLFGKKVGAKRRKKLGHSSDWRVEADRILEHLKGAKEP